MVVDLLSPPIHLVSIGRKDYGHVPRLEKITYNNKHIYKSDSGMYGTKKYGHAQQRDQDDWSSQLYFHCPHLWSERWTELKSQANRKEAPSAQTTETMDSENPLSWEIDIVLGN